MTEREWTALSGGSVTYGAEEKCQPHANKGERTNSPDGGIITSFTPRERGEGSVGRGGGGEDFVHIGEITGGFGRRVQGSGKQEI